MNLKETYNRIAEDWYKDHEQDNWWIEGTNQFAAFLAPKASILDVGCGAGIKTKYLSDKGFGLLGIDFSENFIEIARRENPRLSFKVLDMRQTASLREDFDAIFMQASLLHIPKADAEEVLRNIVTCLKDGGYLYIAVKEQRENGPSEEIKIEDDYGYSYERFFSYYNREELHGYIATLGLKICYDTVTSSGRANWLQIIAQK